MSVRIFSDDTLIYEFGDNEPFDIAVLRQLLLISKFNVDRRDVTLANDIIIECVKNIDKFLVANIDENKSQAYKDMKYAYANPTEIDKHTLQEILDYGYPFDLYNPKGPSRKKIAEYIEKAIFPYTISNEAKEDCVNILIKNRNDFEKQRQDEP